MLGMKKQVLIVEDHPIFRNGLKNLIQESDTLNLEVAGEAESAEKAVQMAKKIRPALALVDLRLAGIKSGIELICELKRMLPHVKIMVISMHTRPDLICEAFKAGAKGFLNKESSPAEILNGIRTVLKGGSFLDNALSQGVIEKLMELSDATQQDISDGSYSSLTGREQEVLRLIADGNKIMDIANSMSLSHKTIENHRCNIMRKLGLENNIQLIRYALRIGLIETEKW